MANQLSEDTIRAAVLAACRKALRAGAGLGTNALFAHGARGSGTSVRRVRDALINEGAVQIPAAYLAPTKPPPVNPLAVGAAVALLRAPAPVLAHPAVTPESPELRRDIRKALAFERSLSAYGRDLRLDIDAAERERVAAGIVRTDGEEWMLAVRAKGDERREREKQWSA